MTRSDPSGLDANAYLYVGANPVNYVDPSGLGFLGIDCPFGETDSGGCNGARTQEEVFDAAGKSALVIGACIGSGFSTAGLGTKLGGAFGPKGAVIGGATGFGVGCIGGGLGAAKAVE